MMYDSMQEGGRKILKGSLWLVALIAIGVAGCLARYLFTVPRFVPLTAVWFLVGEVFLYEAGRTVVREEATAPIVTYILPGYFGTCMGVFYALCWGG
jgi:TRAP-type mannitol/chloroaromatic compound transport system permease small subunit